MARVQIVCPHCGGGGIGLSMGVMHKCTECGGAGSVPADEVRDFFSGEVVGYEVVPRDERPPVS